MTTATATMAKDSTQPIVFPCSLVVDTREQLAYTFADLRADARDGRRPIVVEVVRGTLPSGDYSLAGYESRVSVERKSIQDLFGTIGRGRGRFERELARLATCDFAAVVVESDWAEIISHPPERSRLIPKVVFRSVITWQVRYPRIHWWACPGRAFAERTTFRILERWWLEHEKKCAAGRQKPDGTERLRTKA